MPKQIVLIIGAPGSGKTTDGGALAVQHQGEISSYSMGDMLKEEVAKGSTLGKINNDYISEGELVPTAIVMDKLVGAIRSAPTQVILVDGFPRKAKQMRIFSDFIESDGGMELAMVIEVRVSEEVARERVLGREEKREDDEEKIFINRMRVYRETIAEIESFYEGRGLLHIVDGERSVEEVVEEIDALLHQQTELH